MEGRRDLRVRLLGGLDIEGVDVARLGSRKGRLLVKRLAVARGAPVPADALADALWPDGDGPARPAEQVSVLVSRARAALGAECLTRSDAGYALAVGWLDVDAVSALVAEARQRVAAGALAAARTAAGGALAIARGPLLPEEAGADWLEPERAAVARAVAEARAIAAETALADADAWQASDLAAQAVAEDPYDERALRVLLRALAASGRPAAALVAYAAAAERLRDELGVDPAPETEAVYLSVLRADGAGATSAPPAPAGAAGPSLPGRADALAALDAALARCRDGQARLVTVEGESGIGKTTLLETWVASADPGVLVLRGRGEELRSALPLQPLLDALVGHLRGRPLEEAEALLGPDADVLAPLLGHGIPEAGLPTSLATLSGAEGGAAVVFASLTAVIGRLAAYAPVVLAIDDAHHADRSTAAVLAQCVTQLRHAPLLVVVARRPGQGPAFAAPPDVSVAITLAPLGRDDVAAVVGSDRADELHDRSGGHPLFLVELARSAGGELPVSIRSAVDERVSATGAAADTLRAAAVLGTRVDLVTLAAALRRPELEVLADLEAGVRHHLLRDDGGGFAFAHGIVRDAVYAGVLGGRRALLHREVARALRAFPHSDPLVVAHHARAGGDNALAARALVDAAEVAARRYDVDEALRLVDTALDADDDPAVLVLRSRLLVSAERYDEAAEAAAAALAAGVGAEAYEVAALSAYLLREFDRAERLAASGARLADDPAIRSSCWAIAGRVAHAAGRVGPAYDYYARARVDVPANVEPVLDTWEGLLLAHSGRLAEAHERIAGVSAHSAARLPFLAPHWHMTMALTLGDLGRPAEALREAERLEAATREANVSRFTGRADNIRAWVLRSLGAFDAADEANLIALERTATSGRTEAAANGYLDLAEGALRRGDLGGVQGHLDAAAQPLSHAMRWRHQVRRAVLTARLAFVTGNFAEAEQLAIDAVADAEGASLEKLALAGRLLMARAQHAAGAPVDRDAVFADLQRFDAVGALNGWLVAAEMARELDVAAWSRWAATRVSTLIGDAGEHAASLRTAADSALRDLPT